MSKEWGWGGGLGEKREREREMERKGNVFKYDTYQRINFVDIIHGV